MNATDALLDRVTDVVLDYVNEHGVRPGAWVAQINIHFTTGVEPHALSLHLGEDPIARLVEFGKSIGRQRHVAFVVVIAESTGDELMVACADLGGSANIAYLQHRERWALRSRHYCGRLDASKLEHHPAAAVIRGMHEAGTAVVGST